MKYVLYILCGLMVIAGIGCAALSQMVTPADLDQNAINYVIDSGVADTTDFDGYHNLAMALQLDDFLNQAYQVKSLLLKQQLETNELEYSLASKSMAANINTAKQREEMLFSEQGLLSMGLGLAGFGGLTGILGLMRKRPGDWTKDEVDNVLADANIETTKKESQFIELVKGIQAFIDTFDDNEVTDQKTASEFMSNSVVARLKVALNAEQSADTKKNVASVKATL